MRISDWSSDVCSSDLELHREDDDAARLACLIALAGELQLVPLAAGDVHMATRRQRVLQDTVTAIRHGLPLAECGAHLFRNGERHLRTRRALGNIHSRVAGGQALLRSEEHTSELQSLMRISYAVFCLKKKNIVNTSYLYINQ